MTNGEREELKQLCLSYAAETNDEKAAFLRNQIAQQLPKRHVEQLRQLAKQGPVDDGDVVSKADRGDLIDWQLASRCLVKGQWGYTACTYLGGHVLGAIDNRA